jgi:predicted RNA-binding Zn-ribbon protein involved in translation (DUF1610 family)
MGGTQLNYTLEQWQEEGRRRFGADQMNWRFVCPSCGHVASVRDYQAAGAKEQDVGYSCVGRFTGSTVTIGNTPGPCNYTGGGLFKLNPDRITLPEGRTVHCFAFADPAAVS